MPLMSIADLMKAEVASASFDPVPPGIYDGVITKTDVRQGPKGPYISVEVTIHTPEQHGRKVWRIVSFSEKAVGMPGGVANLLQAAQPDIDTSVSGQEAIVAAVSQAIVSLPVSFETDLEQIVRQGVPATNADGTPEMRATVRQWLEPSSDFVSSVEAEAAGLDDDLPF